MGKWYWSPFIEDNSFDRASIEKWWIPAFSDLEEPFFRQEEINPPSERPAHFFMAHLTEFIVSHTVLCICPDTSLSDLAYRVENIGRIALARITPDRLLTVPSVNRIAPMSSPYGAPVTQHWYSCELDAVSDEVAQMKVDDAP